MITIKLKGHLKLRCSPLKDINKYLFLDEDMSGDHLLAEARVGLIKIFPQMQKQFQVCLHRPVFQVNYHVSSSFIKH